MNYEEFLTPREETSPNQPEEEMQTVAEETEEVAEEVDSQAEIDVQKAVVESLAADKAIQNEKICSLEKENASLKEEIAKLTAEINKLHAREAEQKEALKKVGDVLANNAESKTSNQISLLDRDIELPDRFPGETRDHVLDAIKVARDKAEEDGRIRRAQVLESVLAVNEPSGNLEKKKAALEKFFNDNQNILSGPVIEELQKYGISHKKGDEYLLPSEIIKRTY